MRVHVGADHAGFDAKQQLADWLRGQGHEVVDHGAAVADPEDDYPVFCMRTAAAVVADQAQGVDALGVVLGGSGNGEQIAANKVDGARAALVWSTKTAELARAHNDATVISLGARLHTATEMQGFVEVFLATPFSGDPRHARRIEQLADYERSGVIPES